MTVQSEFVIFLFSFIVHFVIHSHILDFFYIVRFTKLIPIAYQSPNSIEFE